MTPLSVLLYVCLLSDPNQCEERRLPISDVGSLGQCMFWAQTAIAEWSGNHPKYKIVRWKCGYAKLDEEPI
jgi:hypothetical protein